MQRVQDFAALFGYVQCIRVGELLDTDTDGVATGKLERRSVAFRTYVGVSNVSKQDQSSAVSIYSTSLAFQYYAFELLRARQAADNADGHLVVLIAGVGRRAQLSRRDFDVLLLQSLGHIERCQSTSG